MTVYSVVLARAWRIGEEEEEEEEDFAYTLGPLRGSSTPFLALGAGEG